MKKTLIILLLSWVCPIWAQVSCEPEPNIPSVLGVGVKKSMSYRAVKRVPAKDVAADFLPLYPASVKYLKGDVFLVQHNGIEMQQALQIGSSLQLGDVVQTGRQSFVTFVLATGVSSSLPSNTKVRLQQANNSVARYELLQGTIENRVVKKPNARRSTFEITVPNGVLGVRGTHFWVTADVGTHDSAASVLDGVVVARPLNSCSTSLIIKAGQSALLKPIFESTDVKESLAIPDLVSVDARRGVDLAFDILPVAGAIGYEVQVARNADFTDTIAEAKSDKLHIVIPSADIADGFYYVRQGAVDARGINGFGRGVLFLRNRK